MKTVRQLHEEILQQEKLRGRDIWHEKEAYQMDCLLHPENISMEDRMDISKIEKASLSADAVAVLREICDRKKMVYALIAPAFLGQFGEKVTPGQIRTALKTIGFCGMVEVAVFADILTLKEALEFDEHVVDTCDFQLTSCCCLVWIVMIRGIYTELVPHVPGAVSPMIAAGRAVKKINPDAITVFIGPCLAKKKEAKEPDIADAVDYVLTFQETKELFEAAGVHPEEFAEDKKEHSSMAGRIYARTGGVSEAVKKTVAQINPKRQIMVRPRQADGVKACKQMIDEIKSGEVSANFYEGMACEGGCVGGPRALISKNDARKLVDCYGEQAIYQTPLENPYVIDLIEKLGFYTVDDFLKKSDILTRNFGSGEAH